MMRLRGFYDWSRRHPALLDGGIVVLSGLFCLPAAYGQGMVELGVSVPMIIALFWRRHRPVPVFAVVSLACAVQVVLVSTPIAANMAFLFALYALSAYSDRTWLRAAGLGVGFLGALLAAERWYVASGRMTMLGMLALLVLAVWLMGDLLRTRRAYVDGLEERARRLEYERDQQARIARSAERARIAREMHDVVAHSLAVVIAQADGGRYAADTDPEAAKDALETIGSTGRRASAEMRRLLGVLRTEADTEGASADPVAGSAVNQAENGADTQPVAETADPGAARPRSVTEPRTVGPVGTADPRAEVTAGPSPGSAAEPEFSPQPGVERIPRLVEDLRSSGLRCELTMTEPTRTLPEGLSLAAYRVVQEALTNALKHGGPRVRVEVEVREQDGELVLDVRDDGRGAAASNDGDGHGLSGMAERVQLFGGRLSTGPRVGGGFRVLAEIPIREPVGLPR